MRVSRKAAVESTADLFEVEIDNQIIPNRVSTGLVFGYPGLKEIILFGEVMNKPKGTSYFFK